jgi:hypothetical protein
VGWANGILGYFFSNTPGHPEVDKQKCTHNIRLQMANHLFLRQFSSGSVKAARQYFSIYFSILLHSLFFTIPACFEKIFNDQVVVSYPF